MKARQDWKFALLLKRQAICGLPFWIELWGLVTSWWKRGIGTAHEHDSVKVGGREVLVTAHEHDLAQVGGREVLVSF
ncbi:hypothetical protein SAMN05518855_1017146 [Paenibacillus sp. CF384]|nr:hypothetical protein SAMN05518855_1017146 [Paenibacillus sp. CF384]